MLEDGQEKAVLDTPEEACEGDCVAEEVDLSDDAAPKSPLLPDPTGTMPEVCAFYIDSALFLPVERDTMSFEIVKATFVSGSHWAYEVKITTTLPLYLESNEQFPLIKPIRYSKFEWLRNNLSGDFPALIIPPIPPKDATVAADKFAGMVGASFPPDAPPPLSVVQRQRELQYFLNYLASHPALRESVLLKEFLLCPNEAAFTALKERTSANMAAVLAEQKKMSFQTKSALSWLKSKMTSNARLAESNDPEFVTTANWASTTRRTMGDLLAQVEELYMTRIARVDEKLPHSSLLPPMEWACRGVTDADLVPGKRVQQRSGPVGFVRWSGKLSQSDEKYVGVEWDDEAIGNCDGIAPNGERMFQGAKARGSSFVPSSSVYVPLPRDGVIDAVDEATAELGRILRSLTLDQERRLFHVKSDLQLLRGWLDSVLRCVDHFNNAHQAGGSMKHELEQRKGNKREDVSQELALEDRIQKHTKNVGLEKTTFSAEFKKFRNTAAGIWRGVLQNFVSYYSNLEAKQGLDKNILATANKLRSAWE